MTDTLLREWLYIAFLLFEYTAEYLKAKAYKWGAT
jgi:hypothetical protein